jgi:site-specific DNA-methyltransferase (adenine-specific)
MFTHLWNGYNRDSEIGYHVHPTQKPVALFRWCLDRPTLPGDLILDPYMGSGPIARACHEMGRRYIGIEIEERYCEIAAKRLAQGVLSFADSDSS